MEPHTVAGTNSNPLLQTLPQADQHDLIPLCTAEQVSVFAGDETAPQFRMIWQPICGTGRQAGPSDFRPGGSLMPDVDFESAQDQLHEIRHG